jgi:hypothetical protein
MSLMLSILFQVANQAAKHAKHAVHAAQQASSAAAQTVPRGNLEWLKPP